MSVAEEDAQHGNNQDGKHDAARHAVVDEGDDEKEAKRGHQRREGDDAAHPHQYAVRIDDDAGTLQGDEGKKAANAGGDGFFQRVRDGVNQPFADALAG